MTTQPKKVTWEGSIKIERDEENDGRITGWGAALFETEEEAARAIEER